MKNRKISIITSSIAACAIFASIITFNGFSAESKAAETTQTENSITAVKAATTTVQSTVPVNTTVACAKITSSSSSKIQNTQCSNTKQTSVKSANTTKATCSVKNTATNSNCKTTTAKTANCSNLQSNIDALSKSLNVSTAAKQTSNCSAVKQTTTCSAASTASKPSTSAGTKTTTKPATGTTATATSGDYSSFQKKVVELVNKERAKNGLKPLTMNANLNKTATLKSQDMAKLNYFDHTSPTYGSPFDMMKNYGISYKTAGENIAMGQTTPEQVMQGWMNSPGHRANILKASFTQIGVGVAKNSSGRLYWTQQFIG